MAWAHRPAKPGTRDAESQGLQAQLDGDSQSDLATFPRQNSFPKENRGGRERLPLTGPEFKPSAAAGRGHLRAPRQATPARRSLLARLSARLLLRLPSARAWDPAATAATKHTCGTRGGWLQGTAVTSQSRASW